MKNQELSRQGKQNKRKGNQDNGCFNYDYRRWLPEEDKLLIKLYDKKTNKELAKLFDRRENKICRRAIKLHIKKQKLVANKHLSEALLKAKINRSGKRNSKWKGGIIQRNGYFYIWSDICPMRDKRNYVALHRCKMSQKLNRVLNKKEVVHHLDHNQANNNIKNLILLDSDRNHKIIFHIKELLNNLAKTPSHKKHEIIKH